MQTPATGILLDEAETFPPNGRWLVLGGEAALANGLARIGDGIDWRAIDVRERDRAGAKVVVIDEIDIHEGTYDRVILQVPPDRALTRRWLLTAWDALQPGGELLLAGANAEGGKSATADTRMIFGEGDESYRQKHRIARVVRTSGPQDWPTWAEPDGIRPGSWQSFEVDIAGQRVTFQTQAGVFAGNRLDAGTRLLLDHLSVDQGSRVLDVGCGAGILGIAASRQGAGEVVLVDANLLAVETSARNLAALGVTGLATPSDVFSGVPGERFDLIVSNPPFHRGKQVDLAVADALIDGAPAHLRPGGRLLIVANAFLAYGKRMQRVFRQVETIVATRQYHVLAAGDPR